jgi:hypothetical protein
MGSPDKRSTQGREMSQIRPDLPYEPRPIDTSGTNLPTSLNQLLELLAANAHDVWAMGRMNDGWTYGPHRNDEAKLNPCLIPYARLSVNEKEYDRSVVVQTIRSIIALGYEIRQGTQIENHS